MDSLSYVLIQGVGYGFTSGLIVWGFSMTISWFFKAIR